MPYLQTANPIDRKAEEIAESILQPSMLHEYAAQDAAAVLIQNWLHAERDALNQGENFARKTMLEDVSEVISNLIRFRAYIAEHGPILRPEDQE